MKNKYLGFSLILIFLSIFIGCANKIALPHVNNKDINIKISEPVLGYYENKIGERNVLTLDDYDYKSKHLLLIWPDNNYKAICLNNKICLIDTLNNNSFSHSAVIGRKDLFPLSKPSKYFEINQPEILHDEKINMGIKIVYLPELNSISKKEVGESMYEKINQFVFDTYTTTFNQEIKGWVFNGKYDLLEWSGNKYKTICERNNICLVDINNNGNFSHYTIGYEPNFLPLSKNFTYKLVQNVKFNEDSFKYQVLYQGKVGNGIKISFREFKNDMARPAFTQDIEYQLESNKPTIIGFKGLRINVIKATNLNITYSVVKDYN